MGKSTQKLADSKRKAPGTSVFRFRFWLNLVVVLVATCWIPLVSMKVSNGVDGSERVALVPVYRCYQALWVQPNLIAITAVTIHLAVAFFISYVVARLVLRAQQES